jgi:ribosomal protein L20
VAKQKTVIFQKAISFLSLFSQTQFAFVGYAVSKPRVMKALQHAYVGRKLKKREFR